MSNKWQEIWTVDCFPTNARTGEKKEGLKSIFPFAIEESNERRKSSVKASDLTNGSSNPAPDLQERIDSPHKVFFQENNSYDLSPEKQKGKTK